MPALDTTALEERLGALEHARRWSPRAVSRLEAHVRGADDFACFRMNPIQYAAETGLAEAESVDLFLHAAKVGLFRLEWQVLCPNCALTIHSLETLQGVRGQARCIT